jgi:molybdopterin molybdotransferase
MSPRLISVSEALRLTFSRMVPVRSARLRAGDALGTILASSVVSDTPVPFYAIALREGLAVKAFDIVGASAQSPMLLSGSPARVLVGESLPNGCDAVLPVNAVADNGCFVEIAEAIAPGEGVRHSGHDLRVGSTIADRGAVVTPIVQLALHAAGIETVEVLRPSVAIAAGSPFGTAWLSAVLATLGCAIISDDGMGKPHIVLKWATEGTPLLACNPGETGFVSSIAGGCAEITLPHRFDGMVAAFVLLVCPIVEFLTGRNLPRIERPLTRKVTSAVGMTEVVLVRLVDGRYDPLCVGEITLAALVVADAVSVMQPGSEGFPAGALFAAMPLDVLFSARYWL